MFERVLYTRKVFRRRLFSYTFTFIGPTFFPVISPANNSVDTEDLIFISFKILRINRTPLFLASDFPFINQLSPFFTRNNFLPSPVNSILVISSLGSEAKELLVLPKGDLVINKIRRTSPITMNKNKLLINILFIINILCNFFF